MNPLAQMNEAMDYLESHLTEEIDFEQMSRIAGCSEYHFRRMFSYLAGIPLGEYIRRRRLTIAGELLREGAKVIDCSLLCGYDSPDAFRKAFFGMHGLTPSEAKRQSAKLKTFCPMTFQLTIQGGSKMEHCILHKGEFRIVGFKKRITLQFEGVNPQMNSIYESLTQDRVAEMKALCDVEPKGILSVSANFSQRILEGTELDQYVGVATKELAPEGYDVLPVEEFDWAVFPVAGTFSKAVQDTWSRIFAEWLPASGYQLTGGPELLRHINPDFEGQEYKGEIWIPVTR